MGRDVNCFMSRRTLQMVLQPIASNSRDMASWGVEVFVLAQVNSVRVTRLSCQ